MSEVPTYTIPESWAWRRIQDVATTATGGTPSRTVKEYFGGSIPWVKSGELGDGHVYETEETLSELGLASSNAKLFPNGTLCIALYGATVGKLGILEVDAATNQAVCGIFLPPTINRDFVFHYLASIRHRLIEQGKGGAQSNISNGLVRQTWIPIAPENEQRRIVAKIEELFSDLDAGVAALMRAKANLKRYRASVLKAAVEGHLTAAWRAEHLGTETASTLLARILTQRRQKWEADQLAKFTAAGKSPPKNWKDKYPEPSPPDTTNLPQLPKGWCWTSVEQLGDVQLGRQRSPKNRSDKYPTKYVRAANLTEAGLDLSDVMDMEFLPHELDTYCLHRGDVLLSEASGSPDQVGKPVVWNGEIECCCFQNTVIRLRPVGLLSEYALVVFRYYYRSKLFAKVSAGVGINHLSANKFSALPFPLAPLAEQSQIAGEAERQLSLIEVAEIQVEHGLLRAARLRQSILKQAFEGKLVPQDPADEPASVLLARLQPTEADKRGAGSQTSPRRAKIRK
jgi:type I restriction enzyme S subunit